MKFEDVKEKLRGPMVAMVTPFKPNFDLDLDGLKANTRYLIENGIKNGSGVLLSAGAGGEFPSMTNEERKKVLSICIEEAGDKVPVVFGAQHTNLKDIIELCNYAEEMGAVCVQLSPPYYWSQSREEVFTFYKIVCDATNIGIMVYNTTWHGTVDGAGIDRELMSRLVELENVVALKWSSPDPFKYMRVLKEFSDKVAIFDNQWKFTSTLLGAKGIIDPIGNFAPAYVSKLWSLLEKRDYEAVLNGFWELYIPWYEWAREVQKEGIHGEGGLIKPAMKMLGLPCGPARPPYNLPLSKKLENKLREILINAGLSVNR